MVLGDGRYGLQRRMRIHNRHGFKRFGEMVLGNSIDYLTKNYQFLYILNFLRYNTKLLKIKGV
jgi:hypothetical protein